MSIDHVKNQAIKKLVPEDQIFVFRDPHTGEVTAVIGEDIAGNKTSILPEEYEGMLANVPQVCGEVDGFVFRSAFSPEEAYDEMTKLDNAQIAPSEFGQPKMVVARSESSNSQIDIGGLVCLDPNADLVSLPDPMQSVLVMVMPDISPCFDSSKSNVPKIGNASIANAQGREVVTPHMPIKYATNHVSEGGSLVAGGSNRVCSVPDSVDLGLRILCAGNVETVVPITVAVAGSDAVASNERENEIQPVAEKGDVNSDVVVSASNGRANAQKDIGSRHSHKAHDDVGDRAIADSGHRPSGSKSKKPSNRSSLQISEAPVVADIATNPLLAAEAISQYGGPAVMFAAKGTLAEESTLGIYNFTGDKDVSMRRVVAADNQGGNSDSDDHNHNQENPFQEESKIA